MGAYRMITNTSDGYTARSFATRKAALVALGETARACERAGITVRRLSNDSLSLGPFETMVYAYIAPAPVITDGGAR